MNKKAYFSVVASFMLLASSSSYAKEPPPGEGARPEAASEAFFLTPADDIANFTGLDIWKVVCIDKSAAICTDVCTFGAAGDNVVYADLVCTNGKGAMAFDGVGDASASCLGPSTVVCTPTTCKTAIISVSSDDDAQEDELYDMGIECVGRAFKAGFPKHTQDFD